MQFNNGKSLSIDVIDMYPFTGQPVKEIHIK